MDERTDRAIATLTDCIRKGPEPLQLALVDAGWVLDRDSNAWENRGDPGDDWRYTWVAAACHSIHGHAVHPPPVMSALDISAPIHEGPTARLTLRIPQEIYRRFKVHCSIAGKGLGEAGGEILLRWLVSHGEGRELFDRHDDGGDAS